MASSIDDLYSEIEQCLIRTAIRAVLLRGKSAAVDDKQIKMVVFSGPAPRQQDCRSSSNESCFVTLFPWISPSDGDDVKNRLMKT
jgi:hypothetical protein